MKNPRMKMFVVAAAGAGVALGMGGAAMAGGDGGNNAVTSSAPVNQAAVQPHTAGDCNPWAVVGSDATISRTGCSGATAQQLSLGRFQVTFTKNVRRCAYTATMGGTGKGSDGSPGFINVVSRFNNKNAVYVATTDSSGADSYESFHLVVAC